MINRKKICKLLVATVACANMMPVLGITPAQNAQIEGNAIVIGNYLFELDTHGDSFTLENFMNAIRSIEKDEQNAIYYKDYQGHWYELVQDPMLTNIMDEADIDNSLEHIFGAIDQEMSQNLLQTHVSLTPSAFKESDKEAGTFENKIIITLSNQTTAKFKDFEAGDVDSISGASTVGTLPEGLTLKMKRLSDKQAELTLEGKAKYHDAGINSTPSTNDYNQNGIYGDLKLLMLPEMFEQVEDVEQGGVYALCDVIYRDEGQVGEGILNSATQRIINVEQVHYGVLELQEGSLNDYRITLNGEEITPTPIDDQGTLFKFEVNPLEIAEVKVALKSNPEQSETVKLGTGEAPFTGVIHNEDPERILTSGPVNYFDYFLNNYDKNGKVRIEATKSTFDLVQEGVEEVDKTLPHLTTVPTDLGQDIRIAFDDTNAAGKQWKENIYAIFVDYGMGENTRVPVQFEVKEGAVSIKAESTAIQGRNGKHNLIIKANGYNDARITIEIVKDAGSVMLSGDFGPWAHQDLLFELHDFNYAITNPIYEVSLDGQKLEGDCIDYHVVSNLVRLENECLDKLTAQEHTLVIKAEGYKDFVKTFVLEEAPAGEKNPVWGASDDEAHQGSKERNTAVVLDAVSAASSGGGSGEGGSSDGATIRANIIFDFDLIANAKILNALNRATPYANKVIEWWQSLTKDAVITEDGNDKLIDYQYFKNYGSIQPEGYITFKDMYGSIPKQDDDMMTSEHPGIYLNRPYNVKNMLEDGLLGDVYPYYESSAKKSPTLYGKEAYYGEDLIISYEKIEDVKAWEEAIQRVAVGTSYLNYTLDTDHQQIIIPTVGNSMAYGENKIIIQADGYKTAQISVNLQKRNESELEVSKDEEGNIYITGLSKDFAKSIRALSIDGKGLFNDTQVSAGKGDYELKGEVITLRAKCFVNSDGTQQTLKIVAEGYNDVYVQFTPDRVENGNGGQLAEVPSFVKLSSKNTYERGEDILLVVGGTDLNYKVESVYVNDIEVEDKGNAAFNEFRIAGEYFDTVGTYNIILKAKGYKDKVIEVTIEEKDMSQNVPDYVKARQTEIEFGEAIEVVIGELLDSAYAKAFTKIVIDDNKTYTREELKVTDYTSSVLLKDLEVGPHKLVLYADSYKEKVIDVNVNLKKVPSIVQIRIDQETMTTEEVTTTTSAAIKLVVGEPQYTTNTTYLDELETIEIDGVAFEKSDFEIQEESIGFFNRIKFIQINPALLPEGVHKIRLKAHHYQDKVFTLYIKTNE